MARRWDKVLPSEAFGNHDIDMVIIFSVVFVLVFYLVKLFFACHFSPFLL